MLIKGLVQGIGFRPFVAQLADELNIKGQVKNTGGIVTVIAVGDEADLDSFLARMKSEVPAGGFISSIEMAEIIKEPGNEQFDGFTIVKSDSDLENNLPFIPADIATCDRCVAELKDKSNRRYRHPFISCTVCGPRYSILDRLPYDRETITMADFEMCDDCKMEYTAHGNIRRHAQTIACPHCGPKLTETVGNAAQVLSDGGIAAIKDIGGYHLACDANNAYAVDKLRLLKHRENKAFAVMFSSLDEIRDYCEISPEEEKLLISPARPIVLLEAKSDGKKLAKNVCLRSPYIGAMLACNPVQILLLEEMSPLIMTSGNASGDTLEIENNSMQKWLEERFSTDELAHTPWLALHHDRRILRPLDDSVIKLVAGRQQFLRRARGYVPTPIPVDIDGEILSAGGDLKSSFCYVKDGFAYISQYLGDLESISCQKHYLNELESMQRIFSFKPSLLAIDMHPGYYSRKKAYDFFRAKSPDGQVVEIQHHQAHVASVIAEHHLQGDVLGFAFDGTGFGTDGAIWGSESFLWHDNKMQRVAHLKEVKLIGGDEGAKNCKSILVGYLEAAGIDYKDTDADFELIRAAIRNNINTVQSTSMGRLFDAVSCLLGVCSYNSYEGQAPIELENLAAVATDAYPLDLPESGDTASLFKDLINGGKAGASKASLARGFIHAIADYILKIAKSYRIKQVVLSGGCFNNGILLEKSIELLEKEGFLVYTNELVPTGDGGICLGQAYLAYHSKNNK